ncbi:MAG TPA: aminopeptidase, partial [Rhodanobacteraceae bacterium]|nr:aminopeptidase [Rhodanobacteraceae bacterium]
TEPAKLRRKQQVFDEMRREYEHLRENEWHGSHDYEYWFATPINNAKLLPFGLYDRGVPAFAALFDRSGRDWARFYSAVRKLGSEPARRRDAFLGGNAEGTPPAGP